MECSAAVVLDADAMDRLVDAVASFAYYGGDPRVGMSYWRDMTDEAKADDRQRARDLILAALRPDEADPNV